MLTNFLDNSYENAIYDFGNSSKNLFDFSLDNSFEEEESFDRIHKKEDPSLELNCDLNISPTKEVNFEKINRLFEDKTTSWIEMSELNNLQMKDEYDFLQMIDEFNLEINKTIKKEKIFDIFKLNKKIGRLSHVSERENLLSPHDKFSQDNIIRKIKVKFLKSLMNFINKEYYTYLISQKKEVRELIFPIDSKVSKNIKKKDNLIWFNQKIKDVYSNNISKKYKIYKKNENMKRILKFYEEESNKQLKLTKILEMRIEDIYNIYISDEEVDGFEGFDNLKSDMEKIEYNMIKTGEKEKEIKDYLEQYKKIAKSLKIIMENKRIRKK